MNIVTGQVDENLSTASSMIEKAGKRDSDFIVLPEMWATGFAYEKLHSLSKNHFRNIIEFMAQFARQTNSYIIGGSIPEIENDNCSGTKSCAATVYNTCFIFDKSGKIISKYRKIHSFSPTGEDKHFSEGKTTGTIKTENGKIGVLICYDIRFPEIVRKLALDETEILLVPAQFPAVRQSHWEILLQARSIENAMFSAGCNRIGKDRKYEYIGGSMIVDPFGEIIEKAANRQEVLTAELDLSKIKEARERIPVFKDRKPHAYK